MKKLILAIVFLLGTVNAHASIIDVNYTGFGVAKPHDGTLYDPHFGNGGGTLGGNENQYWDMMAYQFTVDESYHVDYLAVSGTIFIDEYQYPDKDTIQANFGLFEGDYTTPYGRLMWGTGIAWTPPYDFTPTDDNALFPMSAELSPGKTYWIGGFNPNSFGPTLFYSTQFLSGAPVPEPATMLLFGTGLVGAFWRRRIA